MYTQKPESVHKTDPGQGHPEGARPSLNHRHADWPGPGSREPTGANGGARRSLYKFWRSHFFFFLLFTPFSLSIDRCSFLGPF